MIPPRFSLTCSRDRWEARLVFSLTKIAEVVDRPAQIVGMRSILIHEYFGMIPRSFGTLYGPMSGV